ncbi:PaaI family thioesterase [Blastomonas sp.]|uniref:PaaI family thioesterase n=1 Tax=Blastomonas sp. TaxID=1909299 RepID=UPI003593CF0B
MTDGFDPQRFFELARKVGHGQALGLEFQAAGADWVELALPWKEQLVGVAETGVLASGAIVSLVDTCGGASVWQALGHFQPIVTIDLRLDYLRPALKGETVIARCACDKLTRQIAFVSGIAHTGDETRPVARAVGTFMLKP